MGARAYIYSVMTGRDTSPFARIVSALLFVASLVYSTGTKLRQAMYRYGILRSYRVDARVVSIGNLTLGGTGKTPFTVMLANAAASRYKSRVAVLTRGYGNDEEKLLAGSLDANVALFVGADRVMNARRAIRERGAGTIILDDGFQHQRIGRDLDIILVDSLAPFGNGLLFPAGTLREQFGSAARADVVVFTKADLPNADIPGLRARFSALKKDLLFAEAVHRPRALRRLGCREDLPLETLAGASVKLVSALGDGKYFEETMKTIGVTVTGHRAFMDHHAYTAEDAASLARWANGADALVTTEKDAVKLSNFSELADSPVPVYVVRIEMEIVKGGREFFDRLDSILGC